jgi:apolipoprotein D and lipocalin family protein
VDQCMEILIERQKWIFFFMILSFLLSGCASIPSGVHAVDNFQIDKYLGTWYEIARLDHSFERGLINVSATYTLRDDGGINVLNKGFDQKSGKWKQIKGRAYFVGDKSIGRLRVTFFWPFYGGYNVIVLDKENYSYTVVCGPTRSYLWILAREKTIDEPVIDNLVNTAKNLNFKTDKLIFVQQN